MDIVHGGRRGTFEHVRHDERKVLRRHRLLLVAELHHPRSNQFHLLRSELDAQFVEIVDDVGLAAHLPEGVGPGSSEALREELVRVEIVLVVAVRMHSAALGEDIASNHGFIVRDAYA